MKNEYPTFQKALGLTTFTVKYRPFNDEKKPYCKDTFDNFEDAYDLAIRLIRSGFNNVTVIQK